MNRASTIEYAPSAVERYTVHFTAGTETIALVLQDTAGPLHPSFLSFPPSLAFFLTVWCLFLPFCPSPGSESYDAIRAHAYAGCQAVLIYFSLAAESTLDRVVSKVCCFSSCCCFPSSAALS